MFLVLIYDPLNRKMYLNLQVAANSISLLPSIDDFIHNQEHSLHVVQ